MNAPALPPARRRFDRIAGLAMPLAIATLIATAAYAGADTTFTPALQKFTYSLCSIYVLLRFVAKRNCEWTTDWRVSCSWQ